MKKWYFIAFLVLSVCLVGFLILNSNSLEKPLYKQTTLKEFKGNLKSKKTFFIYVHKTSCSACQQMKPTINEVIKEHKVEWRAINVEYKQNFDLSFLKEQKIDKTPTLIFYKDGIEKNRLEGVQSKNEIINLLKSDGYL